MEQIAFILGDRFIYRSSIVLTLAALAAIFLFLALYLKQTNHLLAGFCTVPLAVMLTLVCSRFIHWYCSAESYPDFLSAMTNLSTGSFALLGAFAGCFLAAAITRGFGLHNNLPQMLDCMCLAGGAGIAAGRLSFLYHSGCRGQLLHSLRTLPFAYPTVNVVTGATEYRLATFFLQALITGIITIVTAIFFSSNQRHKRKDGDTTLLFLMFYGVSQIVLDSTRYDSLYFRSNGFVSVVQVCGLLALLITICVYSVRLIKKHKFKPWYLMIWLAQAALLGCAGYMEYYVQRHGNEAVFAYSVMSTSLMIVILLTLLIRAMSYAVLPSGKTAKQAAVLQSSADEG